jgi:hypothetical protein
MRTQTVVSRRATPERWQAALRRAFDNNLRLYQVSGTGQHVVLSGSKVGVAYATDGRDCECKSWLHGDPVCQHRALYWYHQGVLDLDEPSDAPAQTARCGACHGDGFEKMPTGDRLSDWVGVQCRRCSGTGRTPIAPTVTTVTTNVVPFTGRAHPRPAA